MTGTSKGRGSSAEGACAFPWAPCLYAPSSAKHRRGREEKVYVPFQRIRVPSLVTPSRSVTARSPRPGGHTPRDILRGSLPRSAPFFSRSPFVIRCHLVAHSFSLVPRLRRISRVMRTNDDSMFGTYESLKSSSISS